MLVLQIDSANSTAGTLYPSLLFYKKLPDSAETVTRCVKRLNPLSRIPASWLSQEEAPPDTTRQRCEILSRLNRTAGIGCEAPLLFKLGKQAEAIARARQIIGAESRGGDHTTLAQALISLGDTVSARRELALAVEAFKHEYVPEDFIAETYYRRSDRVGRFPKGSACAGDVEESQGDQVVAIRSDYCRGRMSIMRIGMFAVCLWLAGVGASMLSGQSARPQAGVAALEIMKSARYATLVTLGDDGQPQARIVDPLLSPSIGSIWIATNPLSRKVHEIRRNPRVTLLFFNAPKNEFVTFLGRATVVTDLATAAKHWKPEWTPFYKGGSNGGNVTLFEVKPFQLEIVSPARGFENDTITWRPVIVRVP